MAHDCDLCGDPCSCDNEDTFLPQPSDCTHICDDECEVGDFDDDFDCAFCEDNGCGACIPDEQCCKSYPDCLHRNPNRGDRQAVSAALVAPLFDTEKK